MCSIESWAISTHTLTAWGGQPTMSRLRRGQISVDSSAPWVDQGDLTSVNPLLPPNTYRSDCWIITFPQQLLTNAPIRRPKALLLPLPQRRRWEEQTGAARGSHQKLPRAPGHFGPGVHEAGACLISGRAIHYHWTLLRYIFSGYQLLYFNIASWLWGTLRGPPQTSIQFYNLYLGGAPALYLRGP